MCFGDQKTGSETKTSSYQASPAVSNAANQNLSFVSNLQNQGYTPYGGSRVAGFSDLQNQGFNLAGQIGGQDANPYGGQTQGLYQNYANAPAQSINPQEIWQHIAPYMSQYTQQALNPQLQMQQEQFNDQNKQNAAQATSSGAYGDQRAGIQQANTFFNQDQARSGLIGQAYNQAFNTAIGAGAQDVANNMQGQQANAGFNEQALARQLGGGQALTGLDQYNMGRGMGLTQFLQGQGGLQQANQQAQLNVPYSDYLAGQQYPFQTSQLMNQSIGAGSGALKGTETTDTTKSQPDNSGWGMLGSLGGSLLGPTVSGMGSNLATTLLPMMMMSDERLKENIAPVGHLYDGQPIYSFNYKNIPTPTIGLMAQDVEQHTPEAVHEIGGYKAVDYNLATSLARAIGASVH